MKVECDEFRITDRRRKRLWFGVNEPEGLKIDETTYVVGHRERTVADAKVLEDWMSQIPGGTSRKELSSKLKALVSSTNTSWNLVDVVAAEIEYSMLGRVAKSEVGRDVGLHR